ncbi:flagellar protein export ATPase FliI [Calderihabitans maritimus]|uniref:Flagellar biosynthesis/type III secretory pathway ATPase n=1 Tax=Calderihabitans maritimus TaxID=1246530 RepID=A0A1Z5HTQ4_9FIRM|nr:flagellar protein export ATPase FliI [Calderihabitans maritimus]GAW92919.1 flagellar biosynthesis/type III secretory pathway ATPase [Calderihabitans maritimus]
MKATLDLSRYHRLLEAFDPIKRLGKVTEVIGLTVVVRGIRSSIGEVCEIHTPGRVEPVEAEVVGFRENQALVMPLGELGGIAPGCRVIPTERALTVRVSERLLGRVVDGLGRPLDGEALPPEGEEYALDGPPPNPLERKRIREVLETGVKAVDGLLTCGKGQRIGIFAGSGVGKSTLLGMIARHSAADVNVIALIGERGREVLEFIEKDLGPEGLKKSVVVVATSDQPALLRIKGAFLATAVAEYFRDAGKDVMLMMDSITRFCLAQREVGLAVGEPPTTRGYPPSVFALLPKLLERAGNAGWGSITGLYTVLVDADDLNEPVSDAVRGILDGHIVLSRQLAAKNHFPAIDVLNSVSRLMPEITTEEHGFLAGRLKKLLAAYRQSEDLINIGAYQKGSNPEVDEALKYYDQIQEFLQQSVEESFTFQETLAALEEIFK